MLGLGWPLAQAQAPDSMPSTHHPACLSLLLGGPATVAASGSFVERPASLVATLLVLHLMSPRSHYTPPFPPTCPSRRWVACMLEDRDEVALVGVDFEGRQLGEARWQPLEGLHMPTQLAYGPGNRCGCYWQPALR